MNHLLDDIHGIVHAPALRSSSAYSRRLGHMPSEKRKHICTVVVQARVCARISISAGPSHSDSCEAWFLPELID